MKPIPTYQEYNALREMWKHSTSASQMLLDLPLVCLSSIRIGLQQFVHWLLNEVADEEEIAQFLDDCKSREARCEQGIRDRQISPAAAEREIADALWWKAIYELQYQEHLDDAALASRLRTFVNIRETLKNQPSLR